VLTAALDDCFDIKSAAVKYFEISFEGNPSCPQPAVLPAFGARPQHSGSEHASMTGATGSFVPSKGLAYSHPRTSVSTTTLASTPEKKVW